SALPLFIYLSELAPPCISLLSLHDALPISETGAVSFMFDRMGLVEYDAKAAGADAMLEAAIEAGAEDVVSNETGHEVYTAADAVDRKSTRLNSSHQINSYAVFVLENKKLW